MFRYLFLVIIVLALSACGARAAQLPADVRQVVPTVATASVAGPNPLVSTSPTVEPDNRAGACPVTSAPDQLFTPPPPYSPSAPYLNEFWYGTEALWTMLRTDGAWQQLPYNGVGYTQKVFWWRQGYNGQAEPQPKLTVTGRRLDGSAPPLGASRATNGYHPDLHWFMLVGVDIPTHGCWEITGRIEAHELSFIVWVAP